MEWYIKNRWIIWTVIAVYVIYRLLVTVMF